MSYETLKAPELSPLAPCNMGVCHLSLFHVIWYQVAIVCGLYVRRGLPASYYSEITQCITGDS
jgi:hypothetical protein